MKQNKESLELKIKMSVEKMRWLPKDNPNYIKLNAIVREYASQYKELTGHPYRRKNE